MTTSDAVVAVDVLVLLPIAVGLAAGTERLLAWWEGRGRAEWVLVGAFTSTAVVLTLVIGLRPPAAEVLRTEGFAGARAARGLVLDPAQPSAWYAGAVGEPASWLALATGRPGRAVHPPEYAALAATVLHQLVFVGEVRCVGGQEVRTFDIRRAGSLADRPPVVAPCP